MKKLGKLSISPDKVMKNEELINLHGGYGSTYCTCNIHWKSHEETSMSGYCGYSSCNECGNAMMDWYGDSVWGIGCE